MQRRAMRIDCANENGVNSGTRGRAEQGALDILVMIRAMILPPTGLKDHEVMMG